MADVDEPGRSTRGTLAVGAAGVVVGVAGVLVAVLGVYLALDVGWRSRQSDFDSARRLCVDTLDQAAEAGYIALQLSWADAWKPEAAARLDDVTTEIETDCFLGGVLSPEEGVGETLIVLTDDVGFVAGLTGGLQAIPTPGLKPDKQDEELLEAWRSAVFEAKSHIWSLPQVPFFPWDQH